MVRKTLITCILGTVMAGILVVGCSAQTQTSSTSTNTSSSASVVTPVDLSVVALKGPTAMGLVEFMDKSENGKITDNNYTFEIAASVDEVLPKITKGDVDIAAVPANAAAVLYNNTKGEVQVLGINTLGVLYICETASNIQSVSDLAGKTIYASGKGSTPEYALNYILNKNGLVPGEDVTIEWKSEHTECLAALTQDANAIALLPQPFVTTAQSKNPAIKVAIDLTKEWDALQADSNSPSALITGAVVARKSFIEENPQAIEAFMSHYKDSVDFVNENIDEAAALVGAYDIVTEEVAKKAIPACNIVFITGEEMKEKLSGYLDVLFSQNPKSVGGALPEESFYYTSL